jgi:hypothetical protein
VFAQTEKDREKTRRETVKATAALKEASDNREIENAAKAAKKKKDEQKAADASRSVHVPTLAACVISFSMLAADLSSVVIGWHCRKRTLEKMAEARERKKQEIAREAEAAKVRRSFCLSSTRFAQLASNRLCSCPQVAAAKKAANPKP